MPIWRYVRVVALPAIREPRTGNTLSEATSISTTQVIQCEQETTALLIARGMDFPRGVIVISETITRLDRSPDDS
jgi:hypothetical protein